MLYIIHSGRDGGNGGENDYVFTNIIPWGGDRQELCINKRDPRFPLNQLWYFMEAADGNIMIISAEDNKCITTADTKDAAKCTTILSQDEVAGTNHTWIFNNTNGCYAFKTADGKTFLSHNGNWQTASQRMGLFNADGSKDEGSRVFIEAAPAGIVTGIEDVIADGNNTTKSIYTITGHQIEKITTPGIYIINGRKTIIR